MARVLIVDGRPAATAAPLAALGVAAYGEIYAAALRQFDPALECVTINAADGEALPPGIALSDFDGVAWTGSPLHVYDDEPAVTGQIELARAVWNARVPCFGSCWGLQVMTVALGGSVRANPQGFEIGIARRIALTGAGAAHPMFAGKPGPFDAIAIHLDEVERLPQGSTLLAANDMSAVQAVEIAEGERSFWGVQYHPEFDLHVISVLIARNKERLLCEGFADGPGSLDGYIADLQAAHVAPARKDIAWRCGLAADVLDPALRRREFANWLTHCVAPRARARRAAVQSST